MRRSWITAAVTFLFLCIAAPLTAFAAVDAALPQSGGDALADVLHKALVGTVTTVVAFIGHRLWGWLGHHKAMAKITQSFNEDAILDRAADEAIDFVEELAHRATKEGAKMASAIKESAGVKHGLEVLERYGVKVDTEKAKRAAEGELKKRITARLGARRGFAPPILKA